MKKQPEEAVPGHPKAPPSVKSASVVLLALVVLSVCTTAAAQDFCSQPVAPYCLDKDSQFDSKVQVDRCQKDLMDYEKDLSDYQKCIKGQLDGLHKQLDEAKKRLEDAKNKFQGSSD
jgi:hypothetical protein